MEISPVEKIRLEKELENLKEELDDLQNTLDSTRADGDFRENTPYQLAKDSFTRVSSRISEVSNILENAVEITPIGGTIVPGRLLKLTYLGEANARKEIENPANEEFILLYSNSGESIVSGILSKDSDLGAFISDGREGRYFLPKGRYSLVYDIKFLGEEHFDSFLEQYPLDSREKVQSLLKGV